MNCYCDSKREFTICCEPYLKNQLIPLTPEQLMRSRYSAYVLGDGKYIVDTTAKEYRYEDDIDLIKEYAKSVIWLGLEVIYAKEAIVEFCAYYRDKDGIKVQHERSNFMQESGRWFYRDGLLLNSKIDRNSHCPCKSGKKYKKCCL
jgi:SEC-C motif-containing protein